MNIHMLIHCEGKKKKTIAKELQVSCYLFIHVNSLIRSLTNRSLIPCGAAFKRDQLSEVQNEHKALQTRLEIRAN